LSPNRQSRPAPVAWDLDLDGDRGANTEPVGRDEFGIRVHYGYDIVPPLGLAPAFASGGPRGEAKDDLGNEYQAGAAHFGLTAGGESAEDTSAADVRVRGGFTLPLPAPQATMLRIRITWGATRSSIWEGPAREVRVSLLS
jgi:hypothetical protein